MDNSSDTMETVCDWIKLPCASFVFTVRLRGMNAHRKSRILYVLHGPFRPNGADIHTRTLFDGLRDRYDTWTIFPWGNRLFLTNDGMTASMYPAELYDGSVLPVYDAPVTTNSLKSIFSTLSPDLVHLQHFLGWPLNLIDLCTDASCPVVATLHDYFAITPEYTMSGVVDARAVTTPQYAQLEFGADISGLLIERQQLLRKVLERAVRIVVPSNHVADTMSNVFDLP
jgi:hypothetical protein